MPIPKTATLLTMAVLAELTVVLLLRWLGWDGTGDTLRLWGGALLAGAPLLAALLLLFGRSGRFRLRSMLFAVALVSLFLTLSVLPLLQHRHAHRASLQLTQAGASVFRDAQLDEYCTSLGIALPEKPVDVGASRLPSWLSPMVRDVNEVPADSEIRRLWLSSDEQCHVVAKNWRAIANLQKVDIAPPVSTAGLRALEKVIPRFEHLDAVYLNTVPAPAGWHRQLKHVRILGLWSEQARGRPLPSEQVPDIASLTNLQVVDVLGYSVSDGDAEQLAASTSVNHVILRRTTVTEPGLAAFKASGVTVHSN